MQIALRKNGNSYPKAHILIISDDQDIAHVYGFYLERSGLNVTLAELNDQVNNIRMEIMPDMIIMDSFAKQGEDIEICEKLRQGTVIPILLITTQSDESYILKAYDAGADEVVVQPISPRLFMAKTRSWLRHIQKVPSAVLDEIRAGEFVLNEEHRVLTLPNNQSVKLTYLEARLLYVLMSHPDQVIETETLVERVWGHYGQGENVLVKNLVYRLRRKIEPNPSHPHYLVSDGAHGYSFSAGKRLSHTPTTSTVDLKYSF